MMVKRIRGGETLEEILHRLIVRNPKITVAELAEELGVREHDLYEWGNMNQPRQFPLSKLLPLMIATENTIIIEHLAARMGLVVFKVRKRGKSSLENAEDLLEYMRKFSTLLTGLVKAFKDKTSFDRRGLLREFDKFLSTAVGLRQDVENLSDQLDLNLEE